MSQRTDLHRNSREANQRVIAAISAICGKALYQGAREARPPRVAASRSANAFAREAAEAELFGACSRSPRIPSLPGEPTKPQLYRGEKVHTAASDRKTSDNPRRGRTLRPARSKGSLRYDGQRHRRCWRPCYHFSFSGSLEDIKYWVTRWPIRPIGAE